MCYDLIRPNCAETGQLELSTSTASTTLPSLMVTFTRWGAWQVCSSASWSACHTFSKISTDNVKPP